MKNLADFKRLPLGTTLTMLENSWGAGKLTGVPRKITKVQTNGFFIEGSFLNFPKSAGFQVNGDVVTLDFAPYGPQISYKINN